MTEQSTRSRAELTPEEAEFYRVIRVRATSERAGQPYIASAIFKLTPISAPGLGGMIIDRYWRVYIDFDAMRARGVKYAAGVLCHVPWHLLRSHDARFERLQRFDDLDRAVWNVAADLEINDDIVELIPDDQVVPGRDEFAELPESKTAEFYYERLVDAVEASTASPIKSYLTHMQQRGAQGDSESMPHASNRRTADLPLGDSTGEGSSSSDVRRPDGAEGHSEGTEAQTEDDGGGTASAGENATEAAGDDATNDERGGTGGTGDAGNPGDADSRRFDETAALTGEGQSGTDETGAQSSAADGMHTDNVAEGGAPVVGCGSGAGGETVSDYELPYEAASAIDPEELDSIKHEVAEAMRSYDRVKPGRIPGASLLWAEHVLVAPPIDWRQMMRGFVKRAISWKAGQSDYVKSRRNRRQPISEVILPALRSPKPRIVIAIDSSASNVEKLGVVVTQITEIVEQVGVRGNDLLMFSADAAISSAVTQVKDWRSIESTLIGGGGTDMRVAIAKMVQIGRAGKADIGILITDLQTDWPTSRPQTAMRFIICGVVKAQDGSERRWIDLAHRAVGDWADIIIIEADAIDQNTQKVA